MHHTPGKCGCVKCSRAPTMPRRIHTDACGIAPARTSGVRRDMERRRLHRRIRAMIHNYRDLHAVGGFMGSPGRALPDLFAFVLDPPLYRPQTMRQNAAYGRWQCTGRCTAALGRRGPWIDGQLVLVRLDMEEPRNQLPPEDRKVRLGIADQVNTYHGIGCYNRVFVGYDHPRICNRLD